MKNLILFTVLFTLPAMGYDPKLLENDLNDIQKNFLKVENESTNESAPVELSLETKIKPLEDIYFDSVKTKHAAPLKSKKRDR